MTEQMETFSLRFDNDGIGVEKTIEFRASDAGEALIVASNEAPGRDVQLWQGEEFLCHLRHHKSDVWTVK